MSDGKIQVPADSTGKLVDTSELTTGQGLVERQRIVLGDDVTPAALAKVTNSTPSSTDYGLTMRRAPKGLTLAAFNFASTGDQDIIPASAGKVNKVWKLWLVVDGDTSIAIKDGVTTKLGPFNYAQGGVIEWPMDEEPWFITSVNAPFRLTLGAAVQCGGIIGYTQE